MSITDTFTGTNGDPLDTDLWGAVYTDSGESPTYSILINNNKAQLKLTPDPTGGGDNVCSDANYSLIGDFDVQIDFSSISFQGHDGTGLGLFFWFDGTGDSAMIYAAYTTSGGHTFDSDYDDGSGLNSSSDARSNDYGALRVVREGSTITFYAKDGAAGSWTQINSVTGCDTGAGGFCMELYDDENTAVEISASLDNFSLTVDAIINSDGDYEVFCPSFMSSSVFTGVPTVLVDLIPFVSSTTLLAATIWDGTAWKTWIDANGNRLTRKYYFTLTGSADGTTDVIIPMSSWQARRKSGEPTFLSVVIPWTQTYQDYVDARPNGTMQVAMAYELAGVEQYRETVCQADLDTDPAGVRVDKGGNSKSITLTGHKTESWGSKTIDLRDVIYESNDGGDYRYRCGSCDMYLNPGDTARYGSNEITVEQIVLIVGAESGGAVYETMDVEEAAT